jgi:hypothetical protein
MLATGVAQFRTAVLRLGPPWRWSLSPSPLLASLSVQVGQFFTCDTAEEVREGSPFCAPFGPPCSASLAFGVGQLRAIECSPS